MKLNIRKLIESESDLLPALLELILFTIILLKPSLKNLNKKLQFSLVNYNSEDITVPAAPSTNAASSST